MNDPGKRKDPAVRVQLAGVIPQATHRFHEALDKLEDELTKARAVMRRDLGALQTTREKKEREEKEAKEMAASKAVNGFGARPAAADAGSAMEGVVAGTDANALAKNAMQKGPANGNAASKPTERPNQSGGTASQQPEATMALATDAGQAPMMNLAATSDDLFGDNLLSTTQGDIDFDSMFHYTDGPGDDNEALAGDGELGELDGMGLLRGLENYAAMPDGGDADGTANPEPGEAMDDSGGIDFGMLDLPAAPVVPAVAQQQKTAGQQEPQQQESTNLADGEVNFDFGDNTDSFDALFNDNNYEGAGNADDFFDFLN